MRRRSASQRPDFADVKAHSERRPNAKKGNVLISFFEARSTLRAQDCLRRSPLTSRYPEVRPRLIENGECPLTHYFSGE